MTGDRFGLYYPEMRFDSDWLRLGAMYWPKLARIIPRGFAPDDDADTRQLIDELDFVVDVAPDDAAAAIARPLLDLLAEHGEELVRTYAFRPDEVRHIDWGDPWVAQVQTARGVHPMKVDGRLRAALATMGMAHEADELAPWLLMESRLAEIYLCALAAEIARQNPVLQPVTHYARRAVHRVPAGGRGRSRRGRRRASPGPRSGRPGELPPAHRRLTSRPARA
jgi:hypothetical protein